MSQINPLLPVNSSLSRSSYQSTATKPSSQIKTFNPVPSKSAYRKFLAEATFSRPLSLPKGGKYVGELKEEWAYPSDHLAIGFRVNNEFNVMSWNVLDSYYLEWVTEKDSQGLNGSQITSENYALEGKSITRREQHIIELIIDSLTHPKAPKEIVNLQECSDAFIEELITLLPPQYQCQYDQGNAVIYDRERLTLVSTSTVQIFTGDPRTIQDLIFEREGKTMRIVNAHLPGDPHGPFREEFARYLMTTTSPHEMCLAMGDINFTEIEMDLTFSTVSKELAIDNRFSRNTPYATNINPRTNENPLTSKAIDHAFFSGVLLEDLPPELTIEGTAAMVEVLC